ncbi:MAG: BrnT family toxin [Bacteroidota bacterium]|jgi:hypothetical protein
MLDLRFEWDLVKAKTNFQKHGISFEEALTVWNDEFAAFLHDPSHSEKEERFVMIGYSTKNNLLIISFTERNGNIRIISSRKATRNERKRHEENKNKY